MNVLAELLRALMPTRPPGDRPAELLDGMDKSASAGGSVSAKCPECGADVPPDAAVCLACWAELGAPCGC